MLKKINYGNRKIFIILLELVEVVAVGSVFVREVVKGAVGTEMEVVVGVAVVVGPKGGRGGILPMDVMGPTMGGRKRWRGISNDWSSWSYTRL